MHLWGVPVQWRFVEKGKFESSLKCQGVFNRIGLQEKINEDDSTEIEKYVCAIYGRKRSASVDKVHLELFLKKYKPKESMLISNTKNFDESQLPPCSRVLKEKIKRTKYITGFGFHQYFYYRQIDCLLLMDGLYSTKSS